MIEQLTINDITGGEQTGKTAIIYACRVVTRNRGIYKADMQIQHATRSLVDQHEYELSNDTRQKVHENTHSGNRDPDSMDGVGVLREPGAMHTTALEKLIDVVTRDETDDDHLIDDADLVLVYSLGVISNSMRDVADVISTIIGEGVPVHVLTEDVTIEDGTAAAKMIDAAARVEALSGSDVDPRRSIVTAAKTSDDSDGGRPPIGYEYRNGALRPADDYDELCTILTAVDDGDCTKAEASRQTEYSRSAITRGIRHRPELYGLE